MLNPGITCRRLPGTLPFIVAMGFLGLTTPVSAQGQGESVRFNTADGVELHGTFYQSAKRTSPTVILLHELGSDSQKKEWISLAENLQKANFSVLSFDFRGHGKSTGIDNLQTFWGTPENKSGVRGFGMATIEYKNFLPQYYPVLANDIAAARAYLERTKNDQGACNTSNLILVGAGDGALLGSLWTRGEYYRFRMIPPAMFGFPPMPNAKPEGNDVICGVWLSIESRLGKSQTAVNPVSLLKQAAFVEATPMVFIYGEGDKKGAYLSKLCEKSLKGRGSKYDLTLSKMVKGNTTLKGAGLLQESLGTEGAIVDYLKLVVKARGNEWEERDYRRAQHIWRLPPAQIIPSKLPNADVPLFDSYNKFLR